MLLSLVEDGDGDLLVAQHGQLHRLLDEAALTLEIGNASCVVVSDALGRSNLSLAHANLL